MSARAIWVLSPSKAPEKGGLLFCRRFPTVEKRVRLFHGDRYAPLPFDQEILSALYALLGLNDKVRKFTDASDSCDKIDQKPVFEVTTSKWTVWPVLVVEQHGLLYCCLSYVEITGDHKPALVTIPSISVCFSLLLGIADFVGPATANITEDSPILSDLYLFLEYAAPFGTVCDTDVSSALAKRNIKPQALPAIPTQRQPSWKPELYKGKSQLNFSTTEQIWAVQYNNIDKPDVYSLLGGVTCKIDLEGTMPEVTINLTQAPTQATPLSHLQTHPCVQSADSYILNEDSVKSDKATRKIRFSPPTESFSLCHYSVPVRKPPITGAYHLKMAGRVANLEVKLYLDEKVKNVFEYCELRLPFHDTGIIQTHDSTTTVGTVSVSQDRRLLVWTIGQRFPSKTKEIVLASSVTFLEPQQPTANQKPDETCLASNAYAQVYFRINDFTFSGCYIDSKSVQVSPAVKFKLNTAYALVSAEYKIWNSHRDVVPKQS